MPENVKGYPGISLFGKLPAYGFFVRHARNVAFENVNLRFAADDYRPAIVCEDVEGVSFERLRAQTMPGVEATR